MLSARPDGGTCNRKLKLNSIMRLHITLRYELYIIRANLNTSTNSPLNVDSDALARSDCANGLWLTGSKTANWSIHFRGSALAKSYFKSHMKSKYYITQSELNKINYSLD